MGFSFGALKKPFLCLAPMEEVTDTVFRQIVAKVARPDVFFTEFANVDGVVHAINNSPSDPSLNLREGRYVHPVLQRLVFTETERPIVAQIWGKDPKNFYEATKLIKRLRFDGVNINMGCPEKDVVKNGCCIALINNRLTVHGRTAKEKSDVPAHWDEIAKVVSLRNQSKSKTVIIGNGDVKDFLDAKSKLQIANVDGAMIGRGILENINAFNAQPATLSPQENINLLREHLKLWEKTWGNTKNFAIMKKFVKAYIKGWEGAGELRAKLMNSTSVSQAIDTLTT
ncbi:MAG: tRNA-dihydrouridine synthase [Candidatus Amesbacteria bacterium GW2011_GWA2_47_11b]|uniref:tRNA-dihydrouridine synthase n=2 Tax=Candidatus Amesiibacteriota TaxID=1752730 RepID=A0A0G1RI37_9BACT|nr:MAG: tRNA-dihydrouridine synthase [Candidatus Amesbacteria bacterium GW2011_GWA2_47_11b]